MSWSAKGRITRGNLTLDDFTCGLDTYVRYLEKKGHTVFYRPVVVDGHKCDYASLPYDEIEAEKFKRKPLGQMCWECTAYKCPHAPKLSSAERKHIRGWIQRRENENAVEIARTTHLWKKRRR